MDADVVAQIVARASSPGFDVWWSKVEHAGYCSSPVELRGHDAHGRPITILTRCKNRGASVCPSCSALYSGDTWQLVHQGIDGPSSVFATLTAPSFGLVHSGSGRVCHPGRAGSVCAHGRSARCLVVHAARDPASGEPLCPECYDYVGHVLFSWYAPSLWHRFCVALRRLVDREAANARVSYIKVVELQRRGVPHFHAVIRADDAPSLDGAALASLVHRAVSMVRLEVPGFGGELVTLRFGTQTDVQSLLLADSDDGHRIASYLAKYVTKSVAEFGLSPRRISPRAVRSLDVRTHLREILWAILMLADSPGPPEMIKWLHTLGYRGHITTKTRAYSTTMGALRARRVEWRALGSDASKQVDEAVGWRFIKAGHRNEGDALLARSADARARASRVAARDELRCSRDEGLGL